VIAPLGASGFASASVPPSPCCAAMPCCLFCLGHDMGVTGINHIACRTPDVARLKALRGAPRRRATGRLARPASRRHRNPRLLRVSARQRRRRPRRDRLRRRRRVFRGNPRARARHGRRHSGSGRADAVVAGALVRDPDRRRIEITYDDHGITGARTRAPNPPAPCMHVCSARPVAPRSSSARGA
jgi:hypothetical protein